MHDGGDPSGLVLAGDADAPLRDAEKKVRRAVERVHDPPAPTDAFLGALLLTDDRIVGAGGVESLADLRFRAPVGLRDHVGRARLGAHPGGGSTEPSEEELAGGLGGVHGDRNELVRGRRSHRRES